jgi:hypothetical protein
MGATDVNQVVQKIESSSTSGHVHDFSSAYARIVQMQSNDGGANSATFKQDMNAVNQKLHADGVLPNLDIVGVAPNNQLVTRDRADNQIINQNASQVNDQSALGSGKSASEAGYGLLTKALGINVSRNADGSYDVKDPFADPKAATAGILQTVFNGLLGGDSSSSGAPLGMNPLLAQAWKGWGDTTPDATPPAPQDPPQD